MQNQFNSWGWYIITSHACTHLSSMLTTCVPSNVPSCLSVLSHTSTPWQLLYGLECHHPEKPSVFFFLLPPCSVGFFISIVPIILCNGMIYSNLLVLHFIMYFTHGASLMAQMVKNLPAMWETWVWSLGWDDPMKKGNGSPLQYS